MTEKKLIAVVGATGSRGGGLVRAILSNSEGEFAVRALTRSAQSGRAQELARSGAEVVEADLDDEASMRDAVEGAYGAYLVTNYWAERAPDQDHRRTRADMELAQAEIAAKAVRGAGVEHVIWSTLEDTRGHFRHDDRVPTLDGRYKVPHFDAKAEADEFFVKYEVPTTFLRTTFYFENISQGTGLIRDPSGKLTLTIPMADQPLSGIAVEDIGKTALGVFKRVTRLFTQLRCDIEGEERTSVRFVCCPSGVARTLARMLPATLWGAAKLQLAALQQRISASLATSEAV